MERECLECGHVLDCPVVNHHIYDSADPRLQSYEYRRMIGLTLGQNCLGFYQPTVM